MKHLLKKIQVKKTKSVVLADYPTLTKPLYTSKDDYQAQMLKGVEALGAQQDLLYSLGQQSLLVIFQGMDAAGKDGLVQHVMTGINPQGCQVYSFKQPSHEELKHDFLWRASKALPEAGRIGIFNRSYYEDVLITRVHPEILAEQRPAEINNWKRFWDHRYDSINNFEKHLHRNATTVVKVFLHVSKDEQRRRLLDRIDEPAKNWKFNAGDLEERKCWDDYVKAYETCLQATSSEHAPWYVVPADDKKNARLIVAELLLRTLVDLKMSYPKVGNTHEEDLQNLRRQLIK